MQTCNMDESSPEVMDIDKISIIFEQCKINNDYVLLAPSGDLHIGNIDQIAAVLFKLKLNETCTPQP